MADDATRGRSIIHSDQKHEGNDVQFDAEGPAAVGCLYCNATGATCALNSSDHSLNVDNDQLIPRIAYEEQQRLFGAEPEDMANLLRSQKHVGDHLAELSATHDAMGFSFDRRRILGVMAYHRRPVGILDGPHASAPDTVLISNYGLDIVGNPRAARQEDLPFYGEDVAVVTNSVGPILTEFGIPPKYFMQAVELDSPPVRAALVAHDPDETISGVYDPRILRKAVVGDPIAAAEAIQDLHAR
jgi:hypothetical protein